MKILIFTGVLICSTTASAQWAVYDEKVFKEVEKATKELIKINNIKKLDTDHTKLDKTYKSELSTATDQPQDLTLGEGTNKAVIKGLDTKFEDLTDLTPAEKAKYIGSAEDCGEEQTNPNMYKACVGLRNLRIQTIKSTQQALRNLYDKRKQIGSLIEKSRTVTGDEIASGVMQRYHFELQSLQALMQADTDQIRLVMEGYRYREKLYEVQQAEAQRGMLSRGARFDKSGKAIVSKPLPFFPPPSVLYKPS